MSSPNQASDIPKSQTHVLAGIVFVIVIGAFFVWWHGVPAFDWNLFRKTFRMVHPAWISFSVVCGLVAYAVRAVRWKSMISHMKPDADLQRLMRATSIGYSASVFMGRAGEFVRPYLIARDQRLTVSSQLAIWSLERLMDLIAVLVLFGVALMQLNESVTAQVGPQIRWILESGGKLIALIGGISLIVLIAFRSFSDISQQRVNDALAFLPENAQVRISGFLKAFADGMQATRNNQNLIVILVWTLVEWVLVGLCYFSIFKSFPDTASLTVVDTLIVLGFVSFGGIIQIPGVGGGMQIVTVIVLTQLFQVAVEPATALAMVLWIIGFAVIVPLGLFFSVRSGIRWRDLRQ